MGFKRGQIDKNKRNFNRFFRKIAKFKPKIGPKNYPIKQSINTGKPLMPSIDKGYRRAVFIAVYKIEKNQLYYLVLNRIKHWVGWEFPKGGIEIGEKPEVSVRRECYEETGLRPLKIVKFNYSGKYKYPGGFPDRLGIVGQTYTLYSAEVPHDKTVKIDPLEHKAYLWLPFHKAVEKLTHEDQKKALRIVNQKIIREMHEN